MTPKKLRTIQRYDIARAGKYQLPTANPPLECYYYWMRPILANAIAVLIEGHGDTVHQLAKPLRKLQLDLLRDYLGPMSASGVVTTFSWKYFKSCMQTKMSLMDCTHHLLLEGMNFTRIILYNEIDQRCYLI